MNQFFQRYGQFLAGIVVTTAVGAVGYLLIAPKEVEAAGGAFVIEKAVTFNFGEGNQPTVRRFVDTEKRVTCYMSEGGLSCMKM